MSPTPETQAALGDSRHPSTRTDSPSRDSALRVGVLGLGAVGLGLASAVSQAGDALTLFTRRGGETSDALRKGFRRTGRFGEVEVPADGFELVDDLACIPSRELDVILLCTKTTATDALVAPLAQALRRSPGSPDLVICHNGWGSAERFASEIDPARIFSARVITGFRRTSPSAVDITVHAAPISVGSVFGAQSARVDRLCAHIDRGGLPCMPSKMIAAELLDKLLYNALLNPLGALTGVPYGALGASAETRALMDALAQEIYAVLDAAGLPTLSSDAATYLERFYSTLLPTTAGHESSMLQDLRAGRPTEIDAICGAVERLGAQHAAATPLCTSMRLLVQAAEAPDESR